jgi:hypothetical protein
VWDQNTTWAIEKSKTVGRTYDLSKDLLSDRIFADQLGLLTIPPTSLTAAQLERIVARAEEAAAKRSRDELKALSKAQAAGTIVPLTKAQQLVAEQLEVQFLSNALKSLDDQLRIFELLSLLESGEVNARDNVTRFGREYRARVLPLLRCRVEAQRSVLRFREVTDKEKKFNTIRPGVLFVGAVAVMMAAAWQLYGPV